MLNWIKLKAVRLLCTESFMLLAALAMQLQAAVCACSAESSL